ncbi:hypothetical protein N7501_006134 [Penicillium viridicatum]|nr:hypothetical protein N7501_006134 [Penicillium viridicatum]
MVLSLLQPCGLPFTIPTRFRSKLDFTHLPLTPHPESMVYTHASINSQPMTGNLAPGDLAMTEGHPLQQYAYPKGRPGPQVIGRQNQLSAGLPMDTQGQRSYSQHPATQPSIPGLTSIQRSINQSSINLLQSN